MTEWPEALNREWERSTAFASGVFDTDGVVLLVNRGMRELLKLDQKPEATTTFFRAPKFENLVASSESEAPVFEGLITIGDGTEAGVSLLGRVFRRPGLVLISCEFDTGELRRNNDALARLNNQVNNLQRELIREKHELERTLNELQTVNERLALLNEQKDRFVGMAAHDLRNPLTVIGAYAKMLGQPGLLDEKNRVHAVAAIQRVSGSMLYLVNDLLDIATIERGRIELHCREVDLDKFVNEVVVFNRAVANSKSIELTWSIEAGLDTWVFDPERIEQVMNNLLSNAFKFSNPETTVSFAVRRSDDHLELVVADEGLGIPAGELANVFADFTKTATRATGGEKGSGLGLAICRRIVELHEGTIAVESELGQGSNFTVRLPA